MTDDEGRMKRNASVPRGALIGLCLLFVACQLVEVRHAKTLRGDETLYIQAASTMIAIIQELSLIGLESISCPMLPKELFAQRFRASWASS